VKCLLMTFALFAFSSLASATDYTFKQSAFSLKGVIKDSSSNPPKSTPAFNLSGTAMWIEAADGSDAPKAQVTLHRSTYECDDVSSYDNKYTCSLLGDKFQELLNDLATHDDSFAAAQIIIKKYYDNASYREAFEIPLGSLDQTGESVETTNLADPDNSNLSVDVEVKTTGMHPL
jgi:hypothetical protein